MSFNFTQRGGGGMVGNMFGRMRQQQAQQAQAAQPLVQPQMADAAKMQMAQFSDQANPVAPADPAMGNAPVQRGNGCTQHGG
jgi:hypothetical protein